MANQDRTSLKGFFETGDVPTEQQFADLIDSYVNRKDDDIDKAVADISELIDSGIVDTSALTDGAVVLVRDFYSTSAGGGGIFRWNTNEAKSNHNGGTIINPDHQAAAVGDSDWYSSTGNGTDDTGNGCFVRPVGNEKIIFATWWGVNNSSDTDAMRAIANFVSEKAYELVLPEEIDLEQDETIEFDGLDSGALAQRHSLTIRGLGRNNTNIYANAHTANKAAIKFRSGVFDIRNFNVIGSSSTDVCGIEFGETASDADGLVVVKQSKIENVSTYYCETGGRINQAFDCEFNGVGFMQTPENGTAFEIVLHDEDNSNNLLFNRLHCETEADNATLLKINGGTISSARRHGRLTFDAMHLEGHRSCTFLDFDGVGNLVFENPNIDINDTGGTAVNPIIFKGTTADVQNILFLGGQISQAASKEIFNITSSSVDSITFKETIITASSFSRFRDLFVDDDGDIELAIRKVVADPVYMNGGGDIPNRDAIFLNDGNRNFEWAVDYDNRRVDLFYSQEVVIDGHQSNKSKIFGFDRNGKFGNNVAIADASTADITIASDELLNNPFIFIVMANKPTPVGGVYIAASGNLVELSASGSSITTTPTAGNMGVSMPDANTIRLHNEIGSEREFIYQITGV